MAGVLDSVDQRTRLAGENRLELLLFHLRGRQQFGINVFKIKEVIQCPTLTQLPEAHGVVRGVANMRGTTIPILDLGMAIGRRPLENLDECYIIVSEFNRKVQGFLVNRVDRIINLNWEEIHPPPISAGKNTYLTAVTRVDDAMIEIIDVEKVLAEVIGDSILVSSDIVGQSPTHEGRKYKILVADDSRVARKQIVRTLEQLGVEYITANDGAAAYKILCEMAKDGPITEQLDILISDVEMPEMDGYTLSKTIRKTPGMEGLYVILHTSLSGGFNESMVKNVGADKFVSKFSADDLANTVLEHLNIESTTELK
ncbi:MAG: chemotaxis protein CheV [Sulfuriflexus sp.]|nr:chemotaxis protein CheV [Sulfuriflexus sp.]